MKNKPYFLVAIILVYSFSPIDAMGQSLPHTFSANTAAKASEVNENFTYLLERFGTRKTTVNCYSGESITTALKNYNHIVISGVCTENISLDGETLPHRVVILEGSSSASDGITASSSASPVIDINYHVFVRVKKLTLKGGQMGLKVRRNGIALISNSIVESNSGYGICACGTSFMFSESNTIRNNSGNGIYATDNAEVNIKSNTISGHSGGSSITITQGAYALINSNTITGSSGQNAVEISRGSSATIKSNTIQSAYIGISVQDSSHAILKNNTVNSNSGLKVDNNASVILAEGNTFSNNSEYGIRVWLAGSLVMWGGAQLTSPTTISGNTKGPIRVDEGGSAYLSNLTLASQSKGIIIQNGNFVKLDNVTITGSGEYGIRVWGTNIGLEDSTISGSTNAEIFAKFSTINLEKTAITGTAGSDEIKLNYSSMLFIGTGTTITGTVTCDGSVDNNSIDNWTNLTLTTSGC